MCELKISLIILEAFVVEPSMCLILFSFQPSSEQPLILGANRDEFFSRPTAAADFWEDTPNVLAGRDLQAGGTWLGITREGRFAAVTNVREPGVEVKNALSRGDLTRNFLQGQQSSQDYLEAIKSEQQRYSGFNLLVGEFTFGLEPSMYYLSNRHEEGIQPLKSGTYGLSNHLLDSPWPKVDDGKAVLRQRLHQAKGNHDVIRDFLEHPSTAEDHRLPSTGVSYEREKALSAIFITGLPDYGTRASTVLTIDKENLLFSEQNYLATEDGEPLPESRVRHFCIDRTNSQPMSVAAK